MKKNNNLKFNILKKKKNYYIKNLKYRLLLYLRNSIKVTKKKKGNYNLK
jgi:hypothetical protein